LSDTTAEVKAILGRTLNELEQVIDNPGVKSLLQGLGSILGVENNGAAGTRRTSRAKAKPLPASGPSTRNTPAAQEKRAQASKRTRTPTKPTGASTARASSSAGPPGRNGRREQLLALVVDQPGITVAQAASQFGLKDGTGLYRTARQLQADGLVRKRGTELHPTAKAQRTR